MSDKECLILVVDDDPTAREMCTLALEDKYEVECVGSGEETLAATTRRRPHVILLDVEMQPGGLDGYETCRQLKQSDQTHNIPVIFVSGRDGIEDRLKGYDAGGVDYIVKPFDHHELIAKLDQLLKTTEERASLKQMADYAGGAAMTAMTSLSEMGCVLEALRQFSGCADFRAVACAVLVSLCSFGLRGSVQVRAGDDPITLTDTGEASPLEVSVIAQMTRMERVVHFKSRMSITYPEVTLLIHNMPIDDAERCGRLRDHLAMIVEGAQVRIAAIAAEMVSSRRGTAIERAVLRMTQTLDDIDRTQREMQVTMRLAAETFARRMEDAYASMALTTAQEDLMNAILENGLNEMLNTQTGFSRLQDQLTSIVSELKGMANAPR